MQRHPRRASLATIVGSSLAVVAAGSLLAFSTLAEQAGLEGLSTGRIDPTHPGRAGGRGDVITIQAPATAPPRDPRDELAELVRESAGRGRTRAPEVVEVPAPQPLPHPRPQREPHRARRIEDPARVAVAGPRVDDEVEPAKPAGPPYGHAYGHYKDKRKGPKPEPKHRPGRRSSDAPVYARTGGDETGSKPPKQPKLEKVKKTKKASPGNGHGKAKGHSKRSHGSGRAHGHSKHAHSKGKGKGHSKHGG